MSGQHHVTPRLLLKMKKMWSSKIYKDKTPLIETNNNQETPDRHSLHLGNPLFENSINSRNEDWTRDQTKDQSGPQSLDQETLCAILQISPCISVVHSPGLDSGLDLNLIEFLIEESVRAHLPQMPSELDTKLQCHLQDLQTVVLQELRRLGPELEHWGLMGNLTQKYHHALVSHMNKLLPQTCTTGACLQLLRWALTKYLSPDLFFHPDLNQNQTRDLDLVLLSDWVQEAQERLMHLLEMEVERQLQMTLHNDLEPCESEEDYSSTYMDVIQRIEAAPSVAQTFSSSLSLKLSHLCLRLLHSFTKRYKTQWFEILSKTKWSELELVTFLKCLKTCKEIKKHVQTKYNREQSVKETVLLLEEIETFTVEILLKDLTIFTERALEKYFRSNPTNKILITELERFFRVEPWLCLKEHEAVMSRCYGLIVSLYIKHMTCLTLHKLRRRWSPNMDASVTDDAQLIHELIHNLCPGVKVWNISLHFVSDVLKTEDIDSIKISTGDLLQKCKENGLTLDTSLLTGLLQWKGLSRSRIREVLDSLTDLDSDLDSPLPSRCCIG